MVTHGLRVWLAILGLLGGLIAGPAPMGPACCSAHDAAEAAVAPTSDTCCSPREEPRAPADDDRCTCPRLCCAAPAPVATIRIATPAPWSEAAVGLAHVAVSRARSAEFHLDLMRPPRA